MRRFGASVGRREENEKTAREKRVLNVGRDDDDRGEAKRGYSTVVPTNVRRQAYRQSWGPEHKREIEGEGSTTDRRCSGNGRGYVGEGFDHSPRQTS